MFDEVAWANVDAEDDGDLTLVPVDPEVERNRVRQRETMMPLETVYEEEDEEKFEFFQPQFTLKQMVIAQAAIAVMLAFIRAFAPGLTAGALGVAAMILAGAISIYEPEDKRVTIGFWCLFGLYLFACVIAIATGPH